MFLYLSIFSYTIAGYIRDNETKQTIPYVNVYIKELLKGDLADSTGYFEIKNIKEGKYTLIVNLIGYKEKHISIDLTKNEDKFFNIYLEKQAVKLEGITVSPEWSDFTNNISISKSEYNRQDFLNIPTSLAEPDVLKVFQLLPSVIAASDYSSALYVRGGASDQNLILLDNAPIFNPFHLGGMFSTFSVDCVESAEFYAGGFNAFYGNRMSSVIDIKTIRTFTKDFGFKYNISFLSASAFMQMKHKRFSFFIDARRTYFDKILELFNKDFPYYFYDINAKINYKMNDNSNISLTYFYDKDNLSITLEDTLDLLDYNWGNTMYAFNYDKILNNVFSIGLSIYNSKFESTFDLLDILLAKNSVKEKGVKANCNMDFIDYSFNTGFELYENDFSYSVSIADSEYLNITEKPTYFAFFANTKYKFKNACIFDLGLRGEYNSFFSNNIYISPRIGIKYFINNENALSFNYGIYNQFLTSVKQETNDFSSVFGEMWLPIYSEYKPQTLKQFILGYEYWYNKNTSFSVEIYDKNYEYLLSSTLIDLIINADSITKAFNPTIGKSNGIEFMLKKDFGKINGWIGYSLSSTKFLKDSVFVHTYYDKTHSLNINLSFQLPYSMSFSNSLVYSTGSPYTAVIGKYKKYFVNFETGEYDDYHWQEVFSDYNEARFPPYFRWDISISKNFRIKNMKNKVILSIVNITNHKNIFFYYYDHDVSPSQRYDFNMLPILPSIGVSGEF